ncbi:MAG: hypothetical protein KAW12_02895 [Candidatus Aminicenantes bacterium]|nr:hypothetical protein [Candidatus Aminicenantes bacterium]
MSLTKNVLCIIFNPDIFFEIKIEKEATGGGLKNQVKCAVYYRRVMAFAG